MFAVAGNSSRNHGTSTMQKSGEVTGNIDISSADNEQIGKHQTNNMQEESDRLALVISHTNPDCILSGERKDNGAKQISILKTESPNRVLHDIVSGSLKSLKEVNTKVTEDSQKDIMECDKEAVSLVLNQIAKEANIFPKFNTKTTKKNAHSANRRTVPLSAE
ncbi:hypothetical protein HAX54_037373 [Datura stramonium]|uniref:Uncharacterized protein n=1 Tax=Datura stramonium TaxID=4076 RepID=A0ABS8SGT2_DATST|nr:hypothetical protein [Datura stramonium]